MLEQRNLSIGNELSAENLVVDANKNRRLESIGIIYEPDFVSPQEEENLLQEIDAAVADRFAPARATLWLPV